MSLLDGIGSILVTGGAGVVGSAMVKRLLPDHPVVVIDDLSSGSMNRLSDLQKDFALRFVKGDVSRLEEVMTHMDNIETVFHFAANADIRYRPEQRTDVDLRTGTIGTYNVLESMRKHDVDRIIFSSSSTVYGEPEDRPTPEDYGPLTPQSLYGASKLACEGLISAFSATYGMTAWIYRFANVLGSTSRTIGKNVIPDFIEKLRADKSRLQILGDGTQTKSYLYIDDCLDGMLQLLEDRNSGVAIYNLGSSDTISVKEIADIVVKEMGLSKVEYQFTGGKRGWKGDIPQMFLDVSKGEMHGWKATRNSSQAVTQSTKDLLRGQ